MKLSEQATKLRWIGCSLDWQQSQFCGSKDVSLMSSSSMQPTNFWTLAILFFLDLGAATTIHLAYNAELVANGVFSVNATLMDGSKVAPKHKYSVEIYLDYLGDPIKVGISIAYINIASSRLQPVQTPFMCALYVTQFHCFLNLSQQTIQISETDEPSFNLSLNATRENSLRVGEHQFKISWYKYMWIVDLPIKEAETSFKVTVTGSCIFCVRDSRCDAITLKLRPT